MSTKPRIRKIGKLWWVEIGDRYFFVRSTFDAALFTLQAFLRINRICQ